MSGRKFDIEVRFNDVLVEEVSRSKYLGIMIDNKLNFNAHIEYLIIKGNFMIRSLKMVLSNLFGLSIEHKIKVYNTVVLPDVCK